MTYAAILMTSLLKSLFFQRAFVCHLPVPWGYCLPEIFLSVPGFFWIWTVNSGEYHLRVKFSGEIFLSLPLASSKVDTGKFSCSPFLHKDLFLLYSHTKDSACCCPSVMRMIDSPFGLILASIMVSLRRNSVSGSMIFGIITETHVTWNLVFPKQHA